jgi:uncharacterized cupredoxin-like copper-binding protein
MAILAMGGLLVVAAGAVACDDDDSEGPDASIPPGTSADSTPESDTQPGADPNPEPGPGVQPAPAGATQVTVALHKWSITPAPVQVTGPSIYFLVTNSDTEPHEFVVIRSALPPDQLPVHRGSVPEDQVDFLGKIEAIQAGTQASAVFQLAPGNYVLICNIAETEDGQLSSHYQQGMHTSFIVE